VGGSRNRTSQVLDLNLILTQAMLAGSRLIFLGKIDEEAVVKERDRI